MCAILILLLAGGPVVCAQEDAAVEAPAPAPRSEAEAPAPAPAPSPAPTQPASPAPPQEASPEDDVEPGGPARDGAARSDDDAAASEDAGTPEVGRVETREPGAEGRPGETPSEDADEGEVTADAEDEAEAADGAESADADAAAEPADTTADTASAGGPTSDTDTAASGSGSTGDEAARAERARREVRERRSQAISQSIQRLSTAEADELSDAQKAALVGQVAQGARVDLGALRKETAQARLTLERLQQIASDVRSDRRTVPRQVRTGQIPGLGAANRWDALQDTNNELEDAIDRAFTERLRLLEGIPKAEEELEQVQSLRQSGGQTFDASLSDVLEDAGDYLQQRRDAMQDLLDLYNEQASVATDAYDDSSLYTEELSAAMVAARKRGMLARSDESISWDTFRAIGSGLSHLPAGLSALSEGYEADGRPAQTMTGWLLRVGASLILLVALVMIWLKLPGWLLRAFDSNGASAAEQEGDEEPDLDALRERRHAELTMPVARAALLAGIAAIGLHLWGLPPAWIEGALAVLGTWAGYFALVAIMRQLLAPRHEDLRIVPLDTRAAAVLFRVLRALALWSAVLLPIIWTLSVLGYEHQDVLVLLSVIHVVGLAVVAGWMIYGAGGPAEFMEGAEGDAAHPIRRAVTAAVPTVLGLAAAIAVLKAVGYVNLGEYMARILYLDLPLVIIALMLDWQIRRRLTEGGVWRPRLRAALWVAFGLAQIWVLGLRYHHWLAIVDFLKRPLFTVAETEVSVFSVFRGILVILIAWLVASFLRNWLSRSERLRSRFSEGVRYALSSLTFYIILVAGILWAMLVGGFPLNALTVLAGMAGIGLGFGLQDVVSNFVAGLILLLERPLAVGDYIEVAGTWGRVTSISLRSTVVRTQDNAHILVPNSDIISNQLTNLSHHEDRILRVVIPVGVGYDSDIDHVIEVLTDVAREHPNVRDFPEPGARLAEFGDSAIVMELLAWIADPGTQVGTTVDLNLEVWRALKREGIEIPFPQQDIHLRSADAPLRIEQGEAEFALPPVQPEEQPPGQE